MANTVDQAPETQLDVTRFQTVDPAKLGYPARYVYEAHEAPEGVRVLEFERSVDGYEELEDEYRQTERTLSADWDIHAERTMTRSELIELATPAVVVRNAVVRRNARHEQRPLLLRWLPVRDGNTRGLIDLTETDPTSEHYASDAYLRHLARPNWHNHLPTQGDTKQEQAWEAFVARFPEQMRVGLANLRQIDSKLRVLSADETLRAEIQQAHATRLRIMYAATQWIRTDRHARDLDQRITDIRRAAALADRVPTRAELAHIDALREERQRLIDTRTFAVADDNEFALARDEIKRRIDMQRRREFEAGLVLTEETVAHIRELAPSLARGRPALLVGDTGGAKTALALHIARTQFGVEPEFVSGNQDVNGYQMMGKTKLTAAEGATQSAFSFGPIVRAMQEGRPVIIDEVDAIDTRTLKRLNLVLQLKPGDRFTIQEDSNEAVIVQPGFVVICTANEKSARYKGLDDLSVEFRNRFGADIVRIYYPDHDVLYGQIPKNNAIIARAALTDRFGNLVPDIPIKELERFVRACHVTQQVFTGNHDGGFRQFVTTDELTDHRPGLTENVLAPRTMVALLHKVRYSYGQLTLDRVLERYVAGIKHVGDRRQMTLILSSHGFLQNRGTRDAAA